MPYSASALGVLPPLWSRAAKKPRAGADLRQLRRVHVVIVTRRRRVLIGGLGPDAGPAPGRRPRGRRRSAITRCRPDLVRRACRSARRTCRRCRSTPPRPPSPPRGRSARRRPCRHRPSSTPSDPRACDRASTPALRAHHAHHCVPPQVRPLVRALASYRAAYQSGGRETVLCRLGGASVVAGQTERQTDGVAQRDEPAAGPQRCRAERAHPVDLPAGPDAPAAVRRFGQPITSDQNARAASA